MFPSTPLDSDSYRYVIRSPRSDTLSGAGHHWDPYRGLKQLLSIKQYDPMERHVIGTICFMYISGFHSFVQIQVISFVSDGFSYFLLIERSLRVAGHSS